MKTNLIKLMERRVDADNYVLKSCLVNPEHIICVQSGKLAKTGPHIIGSERDRELRMIVLRERNSIFVDETVEEIGALLAPKE
jgi:hypothetical protein